MDNTQLSRATEMFVDLRSDVVSSISTEMWEAMQSARLGWATRGEDSSVWSLEALAAEMTGKEAVCFVPTGTMANLAALMTHAMRGDQIIVEADSHILWAEECGFAYVCGLLARPVAGKLGVMDPRDVEQALTESRAVHARRTSLVCLENTHNYAGGTVTTPRETDAISDIAHEYGAAVHLDGARIFNAAVAMGVDARELVKSVDSVSINLNKGLGAPEGALLCGDRSFIEGARLNLKRLGGASMHRAGMHAAAGILALRSNIKRLSEDHRHAQELARALDGIRGVAIDFERVQTNIVMVDISSTGFDAELLSEALCDHGVKVFIYGPSMLRLVTHHDINDDNIEWVTHAFKAILEP